MEENFSDYFKQTGKVAKDYLETRLDLLKLQAAGKLSKALGLFFSVLMAFLLFFFVIVFLGMLVAFWIGERTGSFTIGFTCASGLFILFFVIIIFFRRQLIERPLSRLLINVLIDEIEERDPVHGKDKKEKSQVVTPADSGYVPDDEAIEHP
ncbi:hypothetical protein CLV59_102221 [Chitinophaga dinghuensis]|uniref:Uncharacterized protein n=1 Tax=Chitinophaga dinghuensis TaxID=1539050 RepID=A0A327W4T8_9BACT|nr:hypothetical protein [Chitinophaga dinghuensis]RAJ85517.1 hypothetical protein CLV59_102221 [Chitinophaga dinghuensis]